MIAYGHEEDLVLVGDWDGDGLDTLAVWREARYYFKNSIEGGEADLVILYGKTAGSLSREGPALHRESG